MERNNLGTKSRCRGEPFYQGTSSAAGCKRRIFKCALEPLLVGEYARRRESNPIEFTTRADSTRRYIGVRPARGTYYR